MKQVIYSYQKQADSLEAYWRSQNEKIKMLESFTEQGGSLSPELKRAIEDMQKEGMSVYEKLMRGQMALASRLTETGARAKAENVNVNRWANEVIDSIDINDPETIKRREIRLSLCDEAKMGESALPKDGIIIMLGEEDAYAKALKKYMLGRGLNVKHVQKDLTEDEAEAYIASVSAEGEIAGLAVLGNKYFGKEDRDGYYNYIMSVAHMVKRFVIYIKAQKTDKKYLFLFGTFMDGKLGMTGTSKYYHYGTLGGMAKCIAIELSDCAYVKAIDFEPGMSADTVAEYTDDELRINEKIQEIGRTADGKRYRLDSVLTRSEVTENRCPVGENDVLLVSGGSRGVTSSCILELAKRVKCTFVLLGRAEILKENEDDEETRGITDPKEMKTLVAKRFKASGYKGNFAAIEKKAKAILAQRDMMKTFDAISATGNKVFYYSCDVNDRDGMAEVIAKIENEVGRITGIVHGAGIVADAKIWNKDMKAFRRVFDTKYKGLNNIMDNVDKEKLKLLVTFSSVSGYFGNDGQIDYVAGNEYMDKYAYYVRNKYPNCRALSINWGAWNGGMVNLDTMYIDALRERGFILIPLEVGANYFANEFLMGLPATQMLINNTGEPARRI